MKKKPKIWSIYLHILNQDGGEFQGEILNRRKMLRKPVSRNNEFVQSILWSPHKGKPPRSPVTLNSRSSLSSDFRTSSSFRPSTTPNKLTSHPLSKSSTVQRIGSSVQRPRVFHSSTSSLGNPPSVHCDHHSTTPSFQKRANSSQTLHIKKQQSEKSPYSFTLTKRLVWKVIELIDYPIIYHLEKNFFWNHLILFYEHHTNKTKIQG